MIKLNDLDKWALIPPILDHSKITKMPFWMIQRAKNEVFGRFLKFGLLDWLSPILVQTISLSTLYSWLVLCNPSQVQRSPLFVFCWFLSRRSWKICHFFNFGHSFQLCRLRFFSFLAFFRPILAYFGPKSEKWDFWPKIGQKKAKKLKVSKIQKTSFVRILKCHCIGKMGFNG